MFSGEEGDQQLVERVQKGDNRAFDVLVLKYQHRIYSLVTRFIRDPDEVQDVVQEAFIKAYRALPGFRGESAFFTWLYRIALNRSLQVIQQRRRRAGVDLDDPRVALAVAVDAHNAPQRALELRETYAHLVYAFDRLSPLLRTTVVLTTLQGLSHPEAAAVLSTTEGTIAWRMHEARNQLRRALDAAAAGQTRAEPAEAPRRNARRARADDPDAASCALALALASVVSV